MMAEFGEYKKRHPEIMDLVNVSIKGSRFYSTFRNVFISKIKRFNVLRKYFHL